MNHIIGIPLTLIALTTLCPHHHSKETIRANDLRAQSAGPRSVEVGEPFEIQVGNNVTVTLQAERQGKRQPVRVPKARPIPTRRRTFSPKQKARILEDAKSGVSHAARKHQVARSVIDRWRRELAA